MSRVLRPARTDPSARRAPRTTRSASSPDPDVARSLTDFVADVRADLDDTEA